MQYKQGEIMAYGQRGTKKSTAEAMLFKICEYYAANAEGLYSLRKTTRSSSIP